MIPLEMVMYEAVMCWAGDAGLLYNLNVVAERAEEPGDAKPVEERVPE